MAPEEHGAPATPPKAHPRRRASDANVHYDDGGCKALDDIENRMDKSFEHGTERMDAIEAKLDKNCADTAEVLDILRLGKSFFRLCSIFGMVIKWTVAIVTPIVALVYTIKNGGVK